MIPVANVRDFYAILYDFVYVGYETTVLFVSAVCITTYFVKSKVFSKDLRYFQSSVKVD